MINMAVELIVLFVIINPCLALALGRKKHPVIFTLLAATWIITMWIFYAIGFVFTYMSAKILKVLQGE